MTNTGTDVPTNAAAAIASKIKGSKPRVRRLADIIDDDQASVAPQTVEFVHSKAAKKAKREWKSAQEAEGTLPKQLKSKTSFLTFVTVLCSTLSAVLFGYRMYLKHYGPGPQYLLYSKEQLARHDSSHRVPWIAIFGEVYDVSKAKNYYGKDGGYHFFSGVDASRAFLTGEFADDLNDNVTDFTESQMAGLVHWRDFYLKEYKYKGRVVGEFFDEQGSPTAMHNKVMEGNAKHLAAEKERQNKRLAYPNCSSRWSSNDEMVAGKAEQRCACFEQRGWSNLRKVYEGCKPDAHRCKLIVKDPELPGVVKGGSQQQAGSSASSTNDEL